VHFPALLRCDLIKLLVNIGIILIKNILALCVSNKK
jgi:hypothetical protein